MTWRILFVRLSAMGDVVQSLGAVQALRAARPDWRLAAVVQDTFAPLLEGEDGLEVLAHDRSGGVRGLLATRRRLRAFRADAALDLQGNWKSALICRLSGAAERWGAHGRQRREPMSSLLLNRRVRIEGANRHPASLAHAVVRAMVPEIESRQPRLAASKQEVAAERAAVAALGIDPDRPFHVFVWTDPKDNRAWRPGAMVRTTEASGFPVLWLAGPAEAHLPDPPGIPVLRHDRGEMRRLVALGHVVAAAAGEVVGPDQGATHVLAATGASTTALYGPQDPAATAPPAARVVQLSSPDCIPCRSRRCHHRDGPECMAHEPPLP